MKILIPNATSQKNLGDQAMLEALLGLLKMASPNANVTVHQIGSSTRNANKGNSKASLLNWVAFSDLGFLQRVARTLCACSIIVFEYFGFRYTIKIKGLAQILKDYKDTDLVIFVGNGVLRSRKGLKQVIFLLLNLLPYAFALILKKPVLVGPISLGPFAYAWQARFVFSVMKKVNVLMIRDSISWSLVKKQGFRNIVSSFDHALLSNYVNSKASKSAHNINVGLSLRNWYLGYEQSGLEFEVVHALLRVNRIHRMIIHPIVQVNAPEHNDKDLEVSLRITNLLKDKGMAVQSPLILSSVNDACRTYGRMDLVVGMRMHANILAYTQGVSFVAISYEYKTKGIAESLGMSKYVIDCESVEEKELSELILVALKNRFQLNRAILNKLPQIKTKIIADFNTNFQRVTSL